MSPWARALPGVSFLVSVLSTAVWRISAAPQMKRDNNLHFRVLEVRNTGTASLDPLLRSWASLILRLDWEESNYQIHMRSNENAEVSCRMLDRPWFLPDYWPEDTVGSLPCRPLGRTARNTVPDFIRTSGEDRGDDLQVFGRLVSGDTLLPHLVL